MPKNSNIQIRAADNSDIPAITESTVTMFCMEPDPSKSNLRLARKWGGACST
jgi:hypothetical protein